MLWHFNYYFGGSFRFLFKKFFLFNYSCTPQYFIIVLLHFSRVSHISILHCSPSELHSQSPPYSMSLGLSYMILHQLFPLIFTLNALPFSIGCSQSFPSSHASGSVFLFCLFSSLGSSYR